MATVTKTDIINKINEYNNSNDRKCPAKDLVKLLGIKSVIERKAFEKLLKDMKDTGELSSKKGRGGGLFVPEGVATAVEAEIVDTADTLTEDDFTGLPTIDASPVENDADDERDQSDASYQKLMEMSSGVIPMDEDWVKANWPDAWVDSNEEADAAL